MPRNVGYRNARKNTRAPRKNAKRAAKRPYKAKNKRAVARSIQPIAEGRKLTFVNTTSAAYLGEVVETENWHVSIPETWDHMYRENFLDTLPNQPASKGFTGKTLFSRYLNQQIKIRFNTINHYTIPVMCHVVYGWCKVPYLTQLQSSGSDSASNENGVLIQHNRTAMITRLLSQMYNKMFPVTDPKQFQLMYSKKFQVRGETIEGLDVDTDPTNPTPIIQTVRKDLDYNITWKPNTKYHMRPATKGDGSNGAPPPGNSLKPDDGNANFLTADPQPNVSFWTPSAKNNGDLWTPFFAIQITNADLYGKLPSGTNSFTANPYLFQQNKHYFYDM